MSDRVKADYLRETMKTLNLNQSSLAKILGTGDGTISKWVKDDNCPKLAILACEALMRRSRKKAAASTILLVTIPNGKLETFQQIASGLGFKVVQIDEGM